MCILHKCTNQQITHRNIFLAVLKFFQQSLRAALHFRYHKYRSRPLLKWQDAYFLWAWQAYFAVFQFKNTRITCYESQTQCLFWVATPTFLLGKDTKPTFELKFTSAIAYCRVYWAFISCIKAVFTTQELANVDQLKIGR